MDENEVVEKLCAHLKEMGWSINSWVAAGDRGVDVVATDPSGATFYIEAKGGTSSQKNSSRYGKPYTKSQVFDVTSKGLMQCFHHLAKETNIKVGFVYPEGKHFSFYMNPIKPMLVGIGLTLFCVHHDGSVETTNP